MDCSSGIYPGSRSSYVPMEAVKQPDMHAMFRQYRLKPDACVEACLKGAEKKQEFSGYTKESFVRDVARSLQESGFQFGKAWEKKNTPEDKIRCLLASMRGRSCSMGRFFSCMNEIAQKKSKCAWLHTFKKEIEDKFRRRKSDILGKEHINYISSQLNQVAYQTTVSNRRVDHAERMLFVKKKQDELECRFGQVSHSLQKRLAEKGKVPTGMSAIFEMKDHENKVGYTRIMIDHEGKICPVYLLNTAKREELLSFGLDEEDIRAFEKIKRKQGFRLGTGSYGSVKFGVFENPETGEKKIVAVKKQKVRDWEKLTDKKREKESEKLFKNVEKEVNFQKQAGDATIKVYGMAKTQDKHDVPTAMVVMDLAQGSDLHKALYGNANDNCENPFDIRERLSMAHQLACHMESLHNEKGFAHLDLKPNNVFLGKDNQVKLIDFGLSKQILKGQRLPAMFGVSKRYLAPDILKDGMDPAAADVYSCGVLLTQLLGDLPSYDLWYGDCRPGDVSDMERNARDWLQLSEVPTPELNDLIKSMLSNDPNKRPSMSEVVATLDGVIRQLESGENEALYQDEPSWDDSDDSFDSEMQVSAVEEEHQQAERGKTLLGKRKYSDDTGFSGDNCAKKKKWDLTRELYRELPFDRL
ncbi:protein kinase [Endozoicomonas sp. Mp262]|uniref:protein kinase domain-containing protein n=1 Tax=Endozoicomonas sp. Mp262 TaxID=2919499 RepID=UPI0021D7E9AA